jgi:hypothetical protein
VTVGRAGRLSVCGYTNHESLKHATIFLDPNVTLVDSTSGKPEPFDEFSVRTSPNTPYGNDKGDSTRQVCTGAVLEMIWLSKLKRSQIISRTERIKLNILVIKPIISLFHMDGCTDLYFLFTQVAYTPSDKRIEVKSRKYAHDECTTLTELPPGKHVLTVHANSNALTTLSHVITYLPH